MAVEPEFKTEQELCAAFKVAVERGGRWSFYPETAGWDILLVRKSDGFQIGIQAKLKLNSKVVAQALEAGGFSATNSGPDCRAVLVPNSAAIKGDGLGLICDHIGLSVVSLHKFHNLDFHSINPSLPDETDPYTEDRWHELAPAKRCELPEYVPDCAAGAKSPLQLTAWKIKAIKVAIITETRPVNRFDFQSLGLDHRRWVPPGSHWLTPVSGGWIPGPRMPDFRAQHPKNYDEIKADAPKWMTYAATDQKQLILGGV